MREVSGANGLQEPTSLLLTGTSVTDVLSIAAGDKATYLVYGVIIANADTTARKVSVWWTSNATDFLIFNSTIGATETMTIGFDAPIKLFAKSTARKIRAQAALANVVTVTVLYALAGQTKDDAAN
jgi:integral membrane sensor domain MASE1